MTAVPLLILYCVLILLASLAGGLIPLLVRLTHRRMEIALSFVSGVMLGVALVHLLPGSLAEFAATDSAAQTGQDAGAHAGHVGHAAVSPAMLWLLAGFLVMFFVERYFCFHHHDLPATSGERGAEGQSDGDGEPRPEPGGVGVGGCGVGGHHHDHRLSWTGAAVGLTLHSLIAGIALAASVLSHADHAHAATFVGVGTFLVILLHKPFDALTIGALMARGRHSARARHVVNFLFSLAIPLGVVLFAFGLAGAAGPAGEAGGGGHTPHRLLGAALGFSAGTFLCISLSDLLPELQFHRHDRGKLSLALLLGLGLAWAAVALEA